jgi:hypothetical protein
MRNSRKNAADQRKKQIDRAGEGAHSRIRYSMKRAVHCAITCFDCAPVRYEESTTYGY